LVLYPVLRLILCVTCADNCEIRAWFDFPLLYNATICCFLLGVGVLFVIKYLF